MDTLATHIAEVFRTYNPAIHRLPSEYLFHKGLHGYEMYSKKPLNHVYKLAETDSATLCLELYAKCFAIKFFQNGTEANRNNVQCSWDTPRHMYFLGVKMNDDGPRLPGKTAIRYILTIAHAMTIKQIFVSDTASIGTVPIHNFSLLRIIAGKPGYYEQFPGRYVNSEAAAKSKSVLQSIHPNSIQLCYQHVVDKKGDVDELNRIVQAAIKLLKEEHRLMTKHNILHLQEYIIEL
jgi:hypothetical protein